MLVAVVIKTHTCLLDFRRACACVLG